MSYLFSSSSTKPQASSSSSMSPADVLAMKKSMNYVARGINSRTTKSKRAERVIAKIFNDMAARPIFKTINRVQTIDCNLRYDFVAWMSTSVTVPVFVGQYFALSQFNDTSEYTTLFDQYRFNYIEVWIEPQSANLSSANSGILSSCVDLDDANTPANNQSVEGKQNSLASNGFAGHYFKFKPHMAVAAYSGAFSSFANEPADWIDCASNTVQHYGVKASCTATTAIYVYNMTVRANVSFRNPGI